MGASGRISNRQGVSGMQVRPFPYLPTPGPRHVMSKDGVSLPKPRPSTLASVTPPRPHHLPSPWEECGLGAYAEAADIATCGLSSGACGEFARQALCQGSMVLACGPLPALVPSSPHFVNTCHRGLEQGQSDRPDQLKLLRDVTSVSLGTCSPAAMAPESRGSRDTLCVRM